MAMPDDEEKEGFRLMPLGDIGTLVIALAFLVLFVILIFFPSFLGQFLTPPHQAPQQSGEVSVTIPAKSGN
jgi:uncharacterized SAM-binding protein YcdF (DUF218 family)